MEIELYSDNTAKLYDIDYTYIGKLLEEYTVNSEDTRAEIEKALQKKNKPAAVKEIFFHRPNEIDTRLIDLNEHILAFKCRYFTDASKQAIDTLSSTWFVNDLEHLRHPWQQATGQMQTSQPERQAT